MTMVLQGSRTDDHVDGNEAVQIPATQHWSSIVTTAFNVDAKSGNAGPSESTKIALIVVLGLGLAGVLALAGITFLTLAIAVPIALSAADAYSVYVSASDLAIATQLGTFAPAFVVAGVASLVGSLVTIVKLIQRIDRSPAA
jgi:hypothetical protein